MLLEFVNRLRKTASVSVDVPLPTNPLRSIGTPFNQAVTTSSAPVELPVGTTAVHLTVVGCNARIRFGAGAQTALATDLRILDGVPYDWAVPEGATHMGIIAESGSGSLSGANLVG